MYLETYETYEKHNFAISFHKTVCVWVFFDIFHTGIFDSADHSRHDHHKQREDFDEPGHDCRSFCVRDALGCKQPLNNYLCTKER